MPPIGFAPIWEDPGRNLSQLLIPALIIGARLAAVSMRMTRSSLLEVLRQDYIVTARAKGNRERAVIVRHALKNAFIPVVTIIGQQFSVLLGGTVIVEFIFLQPGVGSLLLDAVLLRDYTLIQGAVLFFAAVICGLVAVALLAPVLAPRDPYAFNLNERGLPIRMQAPNATFPLGTDPLGRDVLSRIVYGARVSLIVGFGSVLIGTLLGAGL